MSDATQITGMGTMAPGAFTRIDPYAREVTHLGRQRHGSLRMS
jgi:hypothetical protein